MVAMSREDWLALPIEQVKIEDLVWLDHDMDVPRFIRENGWTMNFPPIWVEQLVDGHYFVHDGRHRIMREHIRNRVGLIAARVVHHD
jgi:hypothetical protein